MFFTNMQSSYIRQLASIILINSAYYVMDITRNKNKKEMIHKIPKIEKICSSLIKRNRPLLIRCFLKHKDAFKKIGYFKISSEQKNIE